ncbi:ester cyclase [Bradyrhizobium genosp. P]|uniref:ester cyclase n=1 Tax=Bradyrhizobium genosp. P TaxID=83641 RepID=UPI003CEF3E2E
MSMTRRNLGIVTASIVAAASDARTGAMAMSANLERFKAIVERGFSQGDLAVADEVCAEKLLEHEYLSPTDLPGPQILRSQIEGARRSIKDLKLTIEAIVETSDTVWARSKATGFDPRSGKSVTIDVVDICRFSDGKLVEHWGVPDRFALLHQVGALPPPPKGI